ncbi:MAG: hypothetical protein LC803_07770 [Acidobacteria bacterium]|nr:hypothetical protein [Acidobacteriota bacterium]
MTRRLNSQAGVLRGGALILFALATLAADALPQKRTRTGRRTVAVARAAKTSEPPRFGDYPVKEIYGGRVAPVVLDSKRARMFRSRLREDSRQGVNFAGHYAVVFWGCGTGCAQVAVVDARTGKVYWPPVDYVDIPGPPDEDPARHPNFRPDSKLLVLTRNRYDGRGGRTTYYYLFDKNRFRLLRRAEETHPDSESSPEQ